MRIWLVLTLVAIALLVGCTGQAPASGNETSSKGPGGGGTSQNATPAVTPCTPDWQCGDWSDCSASDSAQPGTCMRFKGQGLAATWEECSAGPGTQSRSCTDSNKCGLTEGKPVESQDCIYVPSDFNGVIITHSGTLKDNLPGPSQYLPSIVPESDRVFLQITMNLKNIGYKTFFINEYNFKLEIDNQAYESVYGGYVPNRLNRGGDVFAGTVPKTELVKNETYSGNILFEIPQSVSSAPYRIVYYNMCEKDDGNLTDCDIMWVKA